MEPVSLAQKMQQPRRRFHQMHLCTIRSYSSTGNRKQFEQICFVCNEIRPCDPNAYNESGLRICELKSAGDWLMDAASAIGKQMIFM